MHQANSFHNKGIPLSLFLIFLQALIKKETVPGNSVPKPAQRHK